MSDDLKTTVVNASHRFLATFQAPLNDGGGGGTSGGVTEDWKASVDQRLGQLHDDVRTLWKALLATAVFGLGLIGGLYLYIDQKTAGLDDRLRANEVAITALRGDIAVRDERSNAKLDRIDAKLR